MPICSGDSSHGVAKTAASATVAYAGIHDDIVEWREGARQAAARDINALMTATDREIGRLILAAEQQGERRGGYGDVPIKHLASDLTRTRLDRTPIDLPA